MDVLWKECQGSLPRSLPLMRQKFTGNKETLLAHSAHTTTQQKALFLVQISLVGTKDFV